MICGRVDPILGVAGVDEAKKLRELIASAEVDVTVRREYGVELRRELVAYTRRSICARWTCERSGINPLTVVGWLRTEVEVSTMQRRVEVDVPLETNGSLRDAAFVLEIEATCVCNGLKLLLGLFGRHGARVLLLLRTDFLGRETPSAVARVPVAALVRALASRVAVGVHVGRRIRRRLAARDHQAQ